LATNHRQPFRSEPGAFEDDIRMPVSSERGNGECSLAIDRGTPIRARISCIDASAISGASISLVHGTYPIWGYLSKINSIVMSCHSPSSQGNSIGSNCLCDCRRDCLRPRWSLPGYIAYMS
jgi:hypothetical protein